MAAPKAARKPLSPLVKFYLIAYNAVQCVGWSWVAYNMIQHVLTKGPTVSGFWDAIEYPLKIFQTGAVLEILHAAIGIVPSSVGVTLPQVFSRVFVLWPILVAVPESRDSVGILLLAFAWTVTEVMRYMFYALNLVDLVPSFLLWCRYSFFILLYPIGITGELLCCYAALPHYYETQDLSITLPNKFNTTFSFYYLTVLTMLAYIPVFPQLYGHMLAQRKKIFTPKRD